MDDDVTMAKNDGAANRQLKLFVGLVVVLGVPTLTAAIVDLFYAPHAFSPFRVLICCLIATSSFAGVQVRIRASNVRLSATSAAVLMATTVAPFGWIVLGMAAGLLLSGLRARLSSMKLAFNMAKESVVSATA